MTDLSQKLVSAAERIERLAPLVRLLTIGQVVDAGSAAIDAAGLDPYVLNEGRAERDDRIHAWWLDSLADDLKALAEETKA